MSFAAIIEKVRLERLVSIPAGLLYRLRFRELGADSFVSPFIQGIGLDCIRVGKNSRIHRHTRLLALKSYGAQRFSPKMTIGDDVSVGFGCVLSCVNQLTIGDHVTIADRAYIADSKHGFQEPGAGILQQPLEPGRIVIGDGAWIGYGAFIAGDIAIGEHSIVGANSVVTKSVDPYTIVAGNPARPIKRFDPGSKQWVRLDAAGQQHG